MSEHEATSDEPVHNRYLRAAQMGRDFLGNYHGELNGKRCLDLLETIYELTITRCEGQEVAPNADFLEFKPTEILDSLRERYNDPTDAGKKVSRWWNEGAPQHSLGAGLKDLARQDESSVIPWVEKDQGGGARKPSTYRLTAIKPRFTEQGGAPEPVPEGWVRYYRESERRPAFAPLVGVPLGGMRSRIMSWLAIALMIASVVFAWLSFVHLQQGQLTAVLQSLTTSAVLGCLLYILIGHLAQSRQRGIVVAGLLSAPWNDSEPTQLVFERVADGKGVQLTKFYTDCQVPGCDGRVTVRNGTGSMRGRLAGCCARSPREHVYTFDHATKIGVPIRTAALFCSNQNLG